MRTGLLNQRINLISRTSGKSAFGAPVQSTPVARPVWARVKQQSTNETQHNGAEVMRARYEITIRWRAELPETELEWRGTVMNITGVDSSDPRRQWTVITAESGG